MPAIKPRETRNSVYKTSEDIEEFLWFGLVSASCLKFVVMSWLKKPGPYLGL